MTDDAFDQSSWERRWAHPRRGRSRSPWPRPWRSWRYRSWEIAVAEERPRNIAGSGVDAVIRAVRRG